MKVYNLADVQTFVASEITWRIREISNYRVSFAGQTAHSKAAQARAGIPLLYAHWEGYAKNCTLCYVQFVAARRKKLDDLGDGFWLSMLRPLIDRLVSRPYDKKAQMDIVGHVRSGGESRFVGKYDSIVDTRSNLSFEVLSEMGTITAIDVSGLESEQGFIDKILLERRNNIAHGENIAIDEADFIDVSNRTIDLMRAYGNCVVDAAQKL